MKKYITIFLLLVCGAVYAAAPTVPAAGSIPSRATGAAPLCVFFDASGSTGPTRPFTNLNFQWILGGASTASSYGTGVSKASARGGVAANCYDSTASWSLSVFNSSLEVTKRSGTITVTPADTQWTGTKTICVSTSGTFTGCPSGATEVTSSNATTAVSGNISTGDRRILFRGGETFTAGTAVALNQAIGYLGSFGTGKAIISATASAISVTADDWRIVDLECTGMSTTNACVSVDGNASNTAIIRVNPRDSSSYGIKADPDAHTISNLFIFDSVISNMSDGANGYGMYVGAAGLAIVGNLIDTVSAHGIRVPKTSKAVISSNTIQNVAAGGNDLKLHAPTHTGTEYSEYVVVNDNKFSGGASTITVTVGPQNSSVDERIQHVTIDSNMFPSGSGQQFALSLQGDDIAARNNLFDLSSASAANNVGISMGGATSAPGSTNTVAANNSFYSIAVGDPSALVFINVSSTAVSATVINNLGYAPSANTPTMVSDTGAKATKTTNTGDIGTLTTNPFLTTPSLSNLTTFQPSTAYADDGGTAAFPATKSDFFNCWDKTGANRIGAVVPRASAICRGAP